MEVAVDIEPCRVEHEEQVVGCRVGVEDAVAGLRVRHHLREIGLLRARGRRDVPFDGRRTGRARLVRGLLFVLTLDERVRVGIAERLVRADAPVADENARAVDAGAAERLRVRLGAGAVGVPARDDHAVARSAVCPVELACRLAELVAVDLEGRLVRGAARPRLWQIDAEHEARHDQCQNRDERNPQGQPPPAPASAGSEYSLCHSCLPARRGWRGRTPSLTVDDAPEDSVAIHRGCPK